MNFKKKEYIKLITYILSNSYTRPHVGKTVITTTLYFADFNYYEAYGKSITNESYYKTKKGIKPIHFHKTTDELINAKKLYLRKENYYGTTLYKYYLTKIPNVKFKKKKLNIINTTIKQLLNKNATNILRYASKDSPIKKTKLNNEISYKYTKTRTPNYSILN